MDVTLRGIITLVFVLLIVTAAGLATGIFIQKSGKLTKQAQTGAPISFSPETALYPPPTNTHAYVAISPHRGYAHRTLDIDILSQQGGKLITHIPLSQAMYIEPGQPAFLYNDKAELLAFPAKVEKTSHTDETPSGTITVDIAFSSLPNLPPEKIVAAQIVIASFDTVERLPLTAVQKDDKGQPFIWEAIRHQDGTYRAKHRKLERAIEADWETLVYKSRENVSDIYIVNPDKALMDGQTISVTEQAFKAPDFLNPSRIESAHAAKLARYEMIKNDQQAIKELSTLNAGSNACGTSCGNAGASQDFIARIRALATQAASDEETATP